MQLTGHLEHEVGPPARLEQGIRGGWLGKGSALRAPGQRDADLHDGAQFWDLRMLEELSHEAPKAAGTCTTRRRAR